MAVEEMSFGKERIAAAELEEGVAALEILVEGEKTARLKGDVDSTAALLVQILLRFLKEDVGLFKKKLLEFCEKKGQLNQSVQVVIQHFIEVTQTLPETNRLDVLCILREITQGKLFLEQERANITLLVSRLKEEQGDLLGAADVLFEVPIETFNGVAKKERVTFLLRQQEVALRLGDYTRLEIASKKMSAKTFETGTEKEQEGLYLRRSLALHIHTGRFVQAAQCCHRLWSLSSENSELLKTYLVLVFCSAEQSGRRELFSKIPLSQLRACSEYKKIVATADQGHLFEREFISALIADSRSSFLTFISELSSDQRERLSVTIWGLFETCLLRHNIWALTQHYTAVYLSFLARVLGLEEAQTETLVEEMLLSVANPLEGKIDQVAGVLYFKKKDDLLETQNHLFSLAAKLRRAMTGTESFMK